MNLNAVYKFSNDDIPNAQNREAETKQNLLNSTFLNLIQHARRSRYYRDKFEGIQVQSLSDLPRLPILSSDSYAENMYPYSTALLTTEGFPGGTVSRTGGTTNKPKYAVWGTFDKDRQIEASLPMLETLGLCHGDVVANMLHVGNLYSGLLSVEFETFRMGLTSLALSTVSAETLVQVWKDFRFNAMIIVPSSGMPTLRRALELEPSFKVEKVIFGGQSMSEADQQWLRSALGVKRLASVIASNDGGPFGYQCEEMSGDYHHLMDEYSYVEIVNDNGQPLPDGEQGRILITNLNKFVVPLVRYEIGDVGRIVTKPCSCGRTDRVLEFLGRSKDSFILVGNTTSFAEVRATLEPLGITELQVEMDSVEGVDHMTVRFAAPKEMSSDLLMKTLHQRYGRLELGRFRFEQVEIGSIPRNPVSGKIVGLIDNRRLK